MLPLIKFYNTQASKSGVILILLNNFPIMSRRRPEGILNTYQGIKSYFSQEANSLDLGPH